MKYAVIKVVNGNYSIHAEGIEDIVNAKVNYHGLCQTLWNSPDVKTATVAIEDENLYVVDDCKEIITHDSAEEE